MTRTIATLALLVSVFWGGCQALSPEAAKQGTAYRDVSARALVKRLQNREKLFVVDVREPYELTGQLGALPGVLNVPLSRIEEQTASIPRDREVLVICRSGNRSAQAVQQLRALGYTNVRNVQGGMAAVRRLLPMKKGDKRQ